MSDGKIYELQINEAVVVKRGWLVKLCVVYAGMPNESTYSLAITYTSCHNSIGYNIFVPKNRNETTLTRARLIVQRVTPTNISFRLENVGEHHGKAPI